MREPASALALAAGDAGRASATVVTTTASAHGQAHRDQRKPPHPVTHVIVRRMPLTDVERSVCEAIETRGDHLVSLATTLIAFDTTARNVGDPPRDEAALQEYLAELLRESGASTDLWEPDGDAMAGKPLVPPGLDFVGRPQLIARQAGSGRRPVAAVQRPHRRRVCRAPRRLDERPVRRKGPRRQALRTRRLRHEGRDRGDGVRHPGPRADGDRPGRRPARGHQHRRGVLRRRRHRARRARPHGRCRDRHRTDRVRGLGRLPRIGVRRDHRSRATRPRRGQPARLARGRRGQRDREGRGRARGDRLAAARVVAARRLRPPAAVTAVAAADDGAQRRVAGHLSGLVRAHDRGDVPAGAGRLQRLGRPTSEARSRSGSRARPRATSGWRSTRR